MPKTRPVFLNLLQIRLPPAALASILHRLSGVVLVLALPMILWLLQGSLEGPEGFRQAQDLLAGYAGRGVLLLLLWLWLHHLFAGIRFLLLDCDLGVERNAARRSARLVMGLAPLVALLVFVLWGMAP
jgi:succinate dehydrogenase / fumarate reductase, cytochrome b subunit